MQGKIVMMKRIFIFMLLSSFMSLAWGLEDARSMTNKPMPSILIFVSFSMPPSSLEAYLRDAKKTHASVVIRGLIDNSFQKTFQRIASLVEASGGDGVELNPLWFKRFGIEAVPAVVVVPENSACFKKPVCKKEKDFDVMTGDIALSAALKMIRDRGQLTSDVAQGALNQLQGDSHA
jgi:conjugal transfer pilus assembly protein TrbC